MALKKKAAKKKTTAGKVAKKSKKRAGKKKVAPPPQTRFAKLRRGQRISKAPTKDIRLQAMDRKDQALELRMGGWSQRAIGQELGISTQRVAQLLTEILTEMEDHAEKNIDNVRRLEVQRLDEMIEAIWERAKSGELECLDRVIKLMDRRTKYLGLDAPVKTQANDTLVKLQAGLTSETANFVRAEVLGLKLPEADVTVIDAKLEEQKKE